MQIIHKNTKILMTTFLVLCMTAATFIICLPVTNALTHTESPTYGFIAVSPNPVGVGQPVYVITWLVEMNPLSAANAYAVWHNFTLTITKPDGKTETQMSNATAAATCGFNYVPDQVGNYSFKFTFPGEQITSSTIDNYYKPSTASTTCTVQQEPIAELPQNPLPKDYWTRPIEWQNQGWWPISGNWFGSIATWKNAMGGYMLSTFNPDTTAPQSAHIMWTKPLTFGGQIGGEMYNQNDLSNYYTGKSYEAQFSPPVIINGVLYYNKPAGIQPAYGVTAVDVRTGEELWYQNISTISFGQVYSHHNPNEVGGIAYLWGVSGTTYTMYDATTGNKILDVTGVSGTAVLSANGELLVYRMQPINSTHGFLSMWNATRCVGAASFASNPWQYRPLQGGSVKDYKPGIQFNVTVPIFPQTGTSVSISGGTGGGGCVDDGVILAVGSKSIQDYQCEAGYDAMTGELLWHTNRSIGMIQETNAYLIKMVANGVYAEHNKETETYYGFDLHTGAQLWGPTEPSPYAWDSLTRQGVADNDNFYFEGSSSTRAYNIKTGEYLWSFTAPPAGLQSASPTYLFLGTTPITGGGLIFLSTGNSHGDQLFRGAQLYAVNTTSGQQAWCIDGFFNSAAAIADGCYVNANAYDNQIYCFGKGPSKTTVDAPDPITSVGAPVLIRGSVTDIAAGTKQDAIASNFPNGLPCVSDSSETDFMESVYMQQEMPTNVTGVPVTIDVIDSNGNFRPIGETTSDASGMYTFTWTPDISGDYTVIAEFAGSNSYYSSSAETSFYASEVTPTASSYPQTVLPSTEMYFVISTAAIIIAIIIAVAAAVLLLRKRP